MQKDVTDGKDVSMWEKASLRSPKKDVYCRNTYSPDTAVKFMTAIEGLGDITVGKEKSTISTSLMTQS